MLFMERYLFVISVVLLAGVFLGVAFYGGLAFAAGPETEQAVSRSTPTSSLTVEGGETPTSASPHASASADLPIPTSTATPTPHSTRHQEFPIMAYNGRRDEYLLAWLEGDRIIGLQMNSNGRPKYYDQDFRLITVQLGRLSTSNLHDLSAYPISPLAAAYSEPHDEYLLVWCDNPTSSESAVDTGLDLYMVSVSGDALEPRSSSSAFLMGHPPGQGSPDEETGSFSPPPGNQMNVKTSYNPARDEYLVVWADDRNSRESGLDIWAQRIRANDKKPVGAPFVINDAPGNQMLPALSYNWHEDNFMLAWADDRSVEASGRDLYVQRLTNAGEPLGQPLAVVSADGEQIFPSLSYNRTDNRYFISWSDSRGSNDDAMDLLGMRLNANGWPIRRQVALSRAPGNQTYVALNGSPDDKFMAVWSDYRNPEMGFDLWGRRLNGNGIPYWNDYLIVSDYGTVLRTP